MRTVYPIVMLCVLVLTACGQDQAPETDAAVTPAGTEIPLGQLGNAVQPLAYRLDLTIVPEREDFSGSAEIDVELAEATAVMYLHGNGLKVSSASLTTPAGDSHAAVYEQVDDTGIVRLTFPAAVPAGAATLRFEYTAPFRSRAEGLYHTTIEGESYAFTQFQPIDARRVFPGFDEPAFKVPFDISVTANENDVVVSNAPISSEESVDGGYKRVTFRTTEPLPTYLLAFAVGPLDIVEGVPLPPNKIRERLLPFRATATRGKGDRLRFALDNTTQIVAYLEQYFAVEYPYPKLDLISSPENGTGAMENAGAIVYGDALILLADNASVEQRQRFGAVHAHELAHHWFGDLVTPKWWDDTWLNESFASWMGNKAAHAWRPEYQLDMVSLVQALAAMNLDGRIAARQIRQPVEKNLQIASSFDAITYLKGGGVLSMFESYLGEEGFRDGLRVHMRRFPHGVADVEDFMASLAEGSGRADVVPAFRSFIDQPGVPIVDAVLTCDGEGDDQSAALTLRQSRYLPLGSRGDPAQTWQLPFCVRYGDGQAVTKECLLLTDVETTMPLESAACPDFVMPNADGAGYYRFSLEEDAWRNLMTGFDRLNEKEALVVADSLSAAYQANRLSTEALIEALRIVAASPYTQVAMAPAKDLIRLSDKLVSANARDAVLALMRELYRPRLDALGPVNSAAIETASADAVQRALLRTQLVKLLALDAEDPGLRGELAGQASRYIRLGDEGAASLDESAVDPALLTIALASGVQELGTPFVDTLIDRLVESSDAKFRAEAAVALAATDDAELGNRIRELLLGDQLRSREPTSLAFALARRPSQRRATFEWFKASEAAFTENMSHFAQRWLPMMGAGFCTVAERDEVDEFFSPLVTEWQGAERTLAEVLEGIELCAALREAKGAEVDEYFSGG